MELSVAPLDTAAARSRPVATADTRLLSVPATMGDLFPDRGIRRGSTVLVEPSPGGTSLALAFAGPVTSDGGWAAAVGLPHLGLVAAAELGVRLDRLALVPDPGDQWPVAAASLLDGVDLLLLHPTGRVRPADARRLVARARERGVVMLVLGSSQWPEPPDIKLVVARSDWQGLGQGSGQLHSRRLEVVSAGRRAAARERRLRLWLPGPHRELTCVPHVC